LREVDLGLVEDKLERALRTVHADYLQLDQKPRKALLVLPSLLPTPLVEVALKVLFNHYAQPPAVTLLTTPLLVCVGAGLRNALVVDMGWEECVVTAIGEYKEVSQRRSVRAGKLLTREMAKLLEEEVKNQTTTDSTTSESDVSFEYAEDVTQRMAWIRSRSNTAEATGMIKIPSPDPASHSNIHISFIRFSKPAEISFFASEQGLDDDHKLAIPALAYRVLLSLPVDLRAICVSRVVFTGGTSNLPGLKQRVLQELDQLISDRGWDTVHSYGSATAHHDRILQERSANIAAHRQQRQVNGEVPLSPAKKPIQEAIPHSERIHDDKYDNVTLKAEREAGKGRVEVVKGVVRGVNSLGAWAGASLMSSLRVKGVHEIEREHRREEWNL
jgi:actin-related protein